MKSLYTIDAQETVRVSHRNAAVQRLYDEYLGKPLGERATNCCIRTIIPRRFWCSTRSPADSGPIRTTVDAIARRIRERSCAR